MKARKLGWVGPSPVVVTAPGERRPVPGVPGAMFTSSTLFPFWSPTARRRPEGWSL